jgi:CubicO group peptidase (beta-lactamase class C family)
MASVVIGSDQITAFQRMLGNYANIDHFNIGKTPTDDEITKLINQLKPYNLLILGINGMSLFPNKQFGIGDQQINLIEKLKAQKSITCFFGNPYSLTYFPSLQQSESLVVTYQNDQDAQELAAQLIFGAINANGKLPVSVNDQFRRGSGIAVKSNLRLKYTIPEEVNISSEFLNYKIDSLIQLGLSKKAFPGCQVLIAKDGKVIWNKSYGYFTYENIQPVQNEDLYDLASVTKITGAMPAVMKLYDEGKINLDKPFSTYFSEFRRTNKSEITLRDILTHQARLQSFLPLWFEPGSSTTLRKGMFQDHLSEKYQVRVSSNLYASTDLKQQLFKDIVGSPLWNRKEYHYSDLGFSLIPTVAERLTGEEFQEFLNREFFAPLGAITTGYKPYERFPMNQLVPTELDATFRKELIQGYVHDELAASLGGVSGNAGLFSTANDLAKVMQMYLQMGYYGGKLYFNPNTVREFTKVQFPGSSNRRALGFDKPNPGIPGEKNKFPAADSSPASYGHSGFTGTFVWNDPENQLLFIFLSNRVYPTRKNLMLTELNIRTEMQQAIYEAIKIGLR